jgi:uncharacterized coiled-coil DUF342 family protein
MKRQILQLIGDYKSRLSSINAMLEEHRSNTNGSNSSIEKGGRLNGKAEEYRFAIRELERIVRESNSIEIEIPPSILSSMDALNIPKDKREKVYEVYLAYTLGITINTEEEEFSNWADIYKDDVEDIIES